MRLLAVVLLAALLLAGCSGGADDTERDPPADVAAVEAPWWDIGESWTIRFERDGGHPQTTTLVNFANDTFGDPPHFWLGVRDRGEALRHVFYDDNPFLGRIHWEMLAPHENGMHSAMYDWPLEDGKRWTTPILFGKEDVVLEATARDDGTFAITGQARKDGARLAFDYDPDLRWFSTLTITEPDGSSALRAVVEDHRMGAKGTYHFLRGRDWLDSRGGTTGVEVPFDVRDEGATSLAYALDVKTGPVWRIDILQPDGTVHHSVGTDNPRTMDEVTKRPPPGAWKLRYVGDVAGDVRIRGVIEYKATL